MATTMGRRDFLAGTATAAASMAILRPEIVRGSQANSAIRIGIIGTGGRGNWIGNLFQQSGKYQIVAAADYFEDRVNPFGEKFKVGPSKRFTTLSGYKRLLEQPLDAVVIETPPFFHPRQAADAVAAGKHVFLAKPIAVDVPGCLTVAEAGKQATAKKLVFLVDFQTRASDIYRETLRRTREGALGKLVSAEATYPWAATVHDQPANTPEEKLRYWYQTLALSGDSINEQSIHALDVACWFADADPVKAYGTGGRAIRKHGNIWDHMAVLYQFPGGFTVSFTENKAVPGAVDVIGCRVYGSEGVANTDYMGDVNIKGKQPYDGGRMTNLFTDGCVRNIHDFYDFITAGKCDNPTAPSAVRSNLTCVLGRTAAYAGKEITWKEMMDKAEELKPDLSGLKS
jgi:predicted dehydrogenase